MTTTIEKPALVYVTYIRTTPEKLWEALTKPEFIQQYWYGCRNESDMRVGSKIESFGADGDRKWHGEILECEAPRVLRYTFDTRCSDAGEPPSRVTFEIVPGDPVQLTITHDEFPENSDVMKKVSGGWPGIVAGLKTLLETGKPLNIEHTCGS